jgi:hypothetical protein
MSSLGFKNLPQMLVSKEMPGKKRSVKNQSGSHLKLACNWNIEFQQ